MAPPEIHQAIDSARWFAGVWNTVTPWLGGFGKIAAMSLGSGFVAAILTKRWERRNAQTDNLFKERKEVFREYLAKQGDMERQIFATIDEFALMREKPLRLGSISQTPRIAYRHAYDNLISMAPKHVCMSAFELQRIHEDVFSTVEDFAFKYNHLVDGLDKQVISSDEFRTIVDKCFKEVIDVLDNHSERNIEVTLVLCKNMRREFLGVFGKHEELPDAVFLPRRLKKP